MSLQLSPNFSQAEAEKSQTALRLGIINIVPPNLLPSVKNVAMTILQPVRDHYGVPFSPSSWYRSPSLCTAIGSKTTSQHAKGEAVDLEVPGVDNRDLARWISENLAFDQLILEFYDGTPNGGWVHCSTKLTGEQRRQVLIFDGKSYSEVEAL